MELPSQIHKSILLGCDKKYSVPSAHRAHKSTHADKKHKCSTFGKAFSFKSRLRQHLQKHTNLGGYRCFPGNCMHSYKWAMDSNRHIHTHLERTHRCMECSYQSKEQCLYKHHQAKHVDEYKYYCKDCGFKTKWPTPYARHLVMCKVQNK